MQKEMPNDKEGFVAKHDPKKHKKYVVVTKAKRKMIAKSKKRNR